MNTSEPIWHKEVISQTALETLNKILSISIINSFYLAGGTGLALNLGHRRSYDFDFFNPEFFNEGMILQKMQGLKNIELVSKEKHTLHIIINGVKVSFLGYKYPLLFPLNDMKIGDNSILKIADIREIACMKISAISSRGSKRDFVDLYMVAKEISLSELLTLYKKKYSLTPHNNVHIFKSLMYFDDAEDEPMPDMLVPLSWKIVKGYFTKEIPKLLK